ncbi:MAG TPA: DUF5107 domain-containing protein [Phycisphaerae bacterium]|nr:DUF5107 domain-containing protein [Phycisphaerae bacterium]HNU46401.1 DUF5107 domain-containing protein [Phycisphaerae bacterium]
MLAGACVLGPARTSSAEVKVWEGTITVPTYTWEDDVNPKFWALETATKVARNAIYPYTMQDHLFRTKVDRTYKALFLENEYLKVTCVPQFDGRLHSVLDKTTGQEMFHLNSVIKPSMIAMRGAWISGGVEWNAGPQGHTVTCVSPVDALLGQNADGSAYLEVSNIEKSQRTQWTVRVTLHPGKAYLDERIELFNPTDGLCPYYFWNCTAFPNRPGTRFIFPMTLGTDHTGTKYFFWPVNEGRDLTWLKNHETWASIFACRCTFDFFGAYDVEADRGVVQAADHHYLSGKKAWTWGQWDYGLVSQKNLTDEDGPYIEVQSGPLPTQSDYGALWPRDVVSWQEYWYPVHGLGEGFEFATQDLAVQTTRADGRLELRLIATARFPAARCRITQDGRSLVDQRVDLGPEEPQVVALANAPSSPVDITVTTGNDVVLAQFTSPLPVPVVLPPAASTAKGDEELTAEESYLRGRKYDLEINRPQAQEYYEKALAQDPGNVRALCGLAVLALEVGDYVKALPSLEHAVTRDPQDGRAWYFQGVAHLKLGHEEEALRCADQAARCFGAHALGRDLAGRAYLRRHEAGKALEAFAEAARCNPSDRRTRDHLLIARYACNDERVWEDAQRQLAENPTDLLLRELLALRSAEELKRFATDVHNYVGEVEFETLQMSLVFADLGLQAEALRLLKAVCVDGVPAEQRSPLPLYHVAYWAAGVHDEATARACLSEARTRYRDFDFASHPDSAAVLEYAVTQQPDDAHAHYHLGNLYAHLGRLEEAAEHWRAAGELQPSLSIAWRNLGLYTRVVAKDLTQAATLYGRAIAARPSDQTLYRDRAEILIEDGKRSEAIQSLESMPVDKHRRADVTLLLAQAYWDEQRLDEAIGLLESTPYFVAWEGQATTWIIFNKTHVARGRARYEKGDFAAALADFDAALTYPENLGVGRSNQPEHATALYGRGQALAALGRHEEAKAAWKEGAAGAEGSPEQNEYRRLCAEKLASDK